MQLQTFLREGGTPDDLKRLYAISSRRHRRHDNLVLFKYNQIESPFCEQIVRESRGVILDESRDWEVVSRGFDKFFNHGEGHAASIDWSSAKVHEKVDGSLCVLYHYADQWRVATSGTPDASGEVSGFGLTFEKYFWDTARDVGLQWPAETDTCFMLELSGPYNRIVVPHEKASLTVLGMRDRRTGIEDSVDRAAGLLGIKPAASFSLASVADIVASFECMSPLSQEGYVVVDGAFRRIKVKHPGYVALHHAKDGMSYKAMVEIVRSGESPEVIAAFPELGAMFAAIKASFDATVAELETTYARIADIAEQKAFALEATKTRCSAPLFALRSKKTPSVRAWLAKAPIDTVSALLGQASNA